MIDADYQSAGLGALLVTIGGLVAAVAKGSWAVVRDWTNGAQVRRASQQTHSEKITELAQDGLVVLNTKLSEDNNDLRKRLNIAEARIVTLGGELNEERARSAVLEATVRGLSSRLARLEDANGAD